MLATPPSRLRPRHPAARRRVPSRAAPARARSTPATGNFRRQSRAGRGGDAALARELHEELGIDVVRAYPGSRASIVYPHGTVRLNFFRVVRGTASRIRARTRPSPGSARGGAAVAPMLPANAPVLAARAADEYAITDAARFGSRRDAARLERRLEGVCAWCRCASQNWAEGARAFSAAGHRAARSRRMVLNVLVKSAHRRARTACISLRRAADALARRPAGLVAASCHTREELEQRDGARLDFAVLGPVLEKRAPARAAGLGALSRARARRDAPGLCDRRHARPTWSAPGARAPTDRGDSERG